MPSAITHISWSQGSEHVFLATENAEIFRIPLETCSYYLTCTECAGGIDPSCGWCSVEAKCTPVSECQNSAVLGRYIENGQGDWCFHVVNAQPEQIVIELVPNNNILVSLKTSVKLCVLLFSSIACTLNIKMFEKLIVCLPQNVTLH